MEAELYLLFINPHTDQSPGGEIYAGSPIKFEHILVLIACSVGFKSKLCIEGNESDKIRSLTLLLGLFSVLVE